MFSVCCVTVHHRYKIPLLLLLMTQFPCQTVLETIKFFYEMLNSMTFKIPPQLCNTAMYEVKYKQSSSIWARNINVIKHTQFITRHMCYYSKTYLSSSGSTELHTGLCTSKGEHKTKFKPHQVDKRLPFSRNRQHRSVNRVVKWRKEATEKHWRIFSPSAYVGHTGERGGGQT